MKADYSVGFLFIVGVFITFVAIVAWSALPLIAGAAHTIEGIAR